MINVLSVSPPLYLGPFSYHSIRPLLFIGPVFGNCLIKVLLTELFNLLLLFFTDLRWVVDSLVFEIGIDKLFGDLYRSHELE
jgi:hypothetical protein